MKISYPLYAIALLLLLLFAAPVSASEHHGVVFGGYWGAFLEHWEKVFHQQNGVAVTITVVGIIALFIITRGKWLK